MQIAKFRITDLDKDKRSDFNLNTFILISIKFCLVVEFNRFFVVVYCIMNYCMFG